MKFFKFNLTFMGVILHITTILISLRCCHGNLLSWMCRGTEKRRNLHICQDIGLILLKFGVGSIFGFYIQNQQKIFMHVILTSKWREGKIPIYCLQKMHMTSLWRHLLFNFFENVNFCSSYKGLSAQQIWFNLGQGKQSYGEGRFAPPPGWECIKSLGWDRVKGQLQRFHKLISNDRTWLSKHSFEVIFEKSFSFSRYWPSKSGTSAGSILGFTRFRK